jgi:voltage-gated potassium channel
MKKYFDLFMICLVMFSVFLLIYEISNTFEPAALQFEVAVVSIFIIEYLLRFWLYSDIHKIIIEQYERARYLNIPFPLHKAIFAIFTNKLKYIFSPIALIDLLAIFPSYRSLRILRIFLIFRLFKLFRYSQSIKIFAEVLASKRFDLFTLALYLGFIVFIASTAIYLFESEASGGQIRNLFDAVYWALVTISTVGYGDITAQSNGGRVVSIALILSGLGVLAFFTSIIVSAFGEKIDEMREHRVFTELEKLTDFIIICGFGRVGQEIARQLNKDNLPFVVIDNDINHITIAQKLGYLSIHDDASNNKTLENTGINQGAMAVLCTTGNDVINVYITLTSRQLNPEITIISRTNRQENVKKMLQAGASHVIQPFEIVGLVAAEHVGLPVASEALLGMRMGEKQALLETVTVIPGSQIDRVNVGSIDFTGMKLSLIGVISSNAVHKKHKNQYKVRRHNFYFNPAAHFVLYENDILFLMGRDLSIEHFKSQLEKNRLNIEQR